MTVYVTLGWFGALIFVPVLPCLHSTGGALFVRPNPFPGRFGFHEIWHICVLIGAALHWVVIY
eukprot:gene38394-50681_t